MNRLDPSASSGDSFRAPLPRMADIAVIGGGIVGLATAMALTSRHKASLAVLEAEDRLAVHQTGNNSGVIHSGLYYKPGSLKARLCTKGRDAMYRFCQENGITHERCGKVVVATREDELPALAELERRGTANGLEGLYRLSPDELREHEPNVAGIAGLYVAETGIADYPAVCRAYARKIQEQGGGVYTSAKVLSIDVRPDEIVLQTSRGELRCRSLVNCGGLQSDRIARMCGLDPQLQIVPFRGEYYELIEGSRGLVKNLIYPVPDPRFPFLGVHFTRMVNGGVEAGPNAVLAFARHGYTRTSFSLRDTAGTFAYAGFWRMARKYWKTGFGEMYRSLSKRAFLKALQRLIPALTLDDLLPGGAGVRAQALEHDGSLVDDFKIVNAERMVHVLNAPSPAATASIAIGAAIADTAAKVFQLESAHASGNGKLVAMSVPG